MQAVENCARQNYEIAEREFSETIDSLESVADDNHPHIYVDRARLYALQGDYFKALPDLDKALASSKLKENDRIRGLVTRVVTYLNLSMEEQALQDFYELKRVNPYFPKVEFTENKVIIRNMPDCECYKTIARSFLISSEICEKEEDIQMLDSGVCIAKRKKCKCGCKSVFRTAKMIEKTENCNYWCDKMNLAGMAWCAKVFKRWDCQTSCLFAVDLINDGCHWCCSEGNFYNKCIKQFEDISARMDIAKCDPYWD